MSDLNIIVATADGRRFYAALEAAIGWVALGKSVRLFLQGEAAALLRAPIGYAGDQARREAGQPDLAWLVGEASEMGVDLYVCQSGLALVGMVHSDADAIVKSSGLISFLANVPPGGAVVTF